MRSLSSSGDKSKFLAPHRKAPHAADYDVGGNAEKASKRKREAITERKFESCCTAPRAPVPDRPN